MKVAIAYPLFDTSKGYPTLGQNRQFQYFKEPTYIYPMVPAYAATLLDEAGHQVIWIDCIAENIPYEKFIERIKQEKPDIIAFETKTPVVKKHWKIIEDLKKLSVEGYTPQTVLFGDHVTALPDESFENSKVDFVLTGGDYDFLLVNLCNTLKNEGDFPEKLEPGIYYRKDGQVINTGKFSLNHDLNTLPFIKRDLTKWHLYAYNNGNYRLTPGTYIISGRDCWWGKCSFCSWPTLYPVYRTRNPDDVIEEIEELIDKYQVKEIMDDTGCFPIGNWLKNFCKSIIQRGINKKIYIDCNMRFGALTYQDFLLMKKANFRLILFGLESANQNTLDLLNKRITTDNMLADCRAATKAGLFPHITVMFGYPWESYLDARRTLQFAAMLLKRGYAYTMQSTIVTPYPGTPLFKDCKYNGWLKSENWDDYDMKKPIIQGIVSDEKIMEFVQRLYRVSFQPEFIIRKILATKNINDLKYYFRALKKVGGHIFDFDKEPKEAPCVK